MKVYVLLESKFGGPLELAGVYATRGAAGEAVIDAIQEVRGCEYNCEVQEREVVEEKDRCIECGAELVDGGDWGYCTPCAPPWRKCDE
jgi:hypothetical protein